MKPKITILSVGYGDAALLGEATTSMLSGGRQVILRTEKNEISAWLKTRSIPFLSLDSLYETSEDFDTLYSSIASILWTKAVTAPVVYAVTDAMTDGSVDAVFRTKPENGEVEILPGAALAELYLPSFRSALPEADLRIVSAERLLHNQYDPDRSLLILELDNALLAGVIKLRLSERLPDNFELLFMRDVHSCKRIHLFELDRQPDFDHMTALFVPSCPMENRESFTPDDLPYALRLLHNRKPVTATGSPHLTLEPSLRETAERCTAAMETDDAETLKEALVDLLLQCMLHADVAENFDEFTKNEMMDALIRRIRGQKD